MAGRYRCRSPRRSFPQASACLRTALACPGWSTWRLEVGGCDRNAVTNTREKWLAITPTDGDTRMKYMLLIYMGDQAVAEAELEHCYVDSTQLAQNLHANGKFLGANPLHPTSTATSVRVRDGQPVVTDGPFAETREHLGGYFLIDAKNLDEAIGIAARIPGARKGTVEIRPVMEMAGLPEG